MVARHPSARASSFFDRYHRLKQLIMSYFLPHLPSGWHVDEAIKSEEDRVVVLRFGHDWDTQCMTMDETLYSVAEKVQNFAVIYLVDITAVPDFNKARLTASSRVIRMTDVFGFGQMYELYDPCTVMFFYRYVICVCAYLE
jgi:U5 snRNP protein, DIM1 family